MLTIRSFQEQVLSPKRIIFVNDQVYFKCQGAIFSEETTSPFLTDAIDGTLLDTVMDPEMEVDPASAFDTYMVYYSERHRTYQSDTLRAITGILNRLSTQMKYRFFQGLPTGVFAMYVIFVRYYPLQALERRPGFPSYSWTGWTGRVQ